jgi:hypothetical protein
MIRQTPSTHQENAKYGETGADRIGLAEGKNSIGRTTTKMVIMRKTKVPKMPYASDMKNVTTIVE